MMKFFITIFFLFLCACGPASPQTSPHATLTQFYQALAAGRYAEAAANYGGSYDTIIGWNGDVAADNHVKLIEAGCTRQLRCLTVKQIVSEQQLSPTEWLFMVEFANPDGTTFVRGPCCGASPQDQPPQHQFEQRVVQTANGWKVTSLGVYVP
ncbi:MAG: hypothetical protein MUD01_06845 [Chloroflexaceae bacterium]|jgi:hypothetical protein|nr:hypothetical protein [Chloroflexaceae bacterium]